MVKTHISPKGINRGGFPQNHVAVDGDDMAVHNVDSTERRTNDGMAELVDARKVCERKIII